jgi:acylphosphatase
MIRRHIIVEGRVQGVWYRQTCQEMAMAEGVTGWVRNNDDGSVEAALEGDPAAVDRVVSWMRIGPARAVVTLVNVVDESPRGEQSFRVV